MKLTYYERVSLIFLLEILKSLPSQDKLSDESIELMSEALAHGWERDYFSAIDMWIEKETFSAAECKEVIDILQMHRLIINAKYQTFVSSDEDRFFLKFQGFSGNEESKYLSYTNYLIERRGLFMELRNKGGHNSHFPMLDRYRRMAAEWRKADDSFNLNEADVLRILSASKHTPL